MKTHPSKLEKLISELCPKGVEYKELGKIAKYSKQRIDADQLNRDNYIGVDNLLPNKQGKTISNYVPSAGKMTRFEVGDVLLGNIRPYLKKIWLTTNFGGTNGDVLVIQIHDRESLLPEFLYYLISSDDFFKFDMKHAKGAKMPRGDKDSILKYLIPIPPLAIQEEIVKILNSFTELEAELEEKLESEFEARKKQHKQYQDTLLTFKDEVDWTTLDNVADIGTGGSNTNEGLEEGLYPFFVRSQIVRYKNSHEFDETAIITSGDGAGVGKIFHFIEGKYALHQRAYRIRITDNRLNPKFFFYFFKQTFGKYILGSAVHSSVTSIRRPMLNRYLVPIPPYEEQERIVAVLDKFDALMNDISVVLPAELSARRSQYEHYRSKLLTFNEYAK